jgi:xylan 1,4-beta-xylosidase
MRRGGENAENYPARPQRAVWPLHDNPIEVPESAESVWLRVDVDQLYRYSYSFDGETWQTVPVTYEAWKLSDDYIGGRGFFTGAFVGLHCEDISGDGCHTVRLLPISRG